MTVFVKLVSGRYFSSENIIHNITRKIVHGFVIIERKNDITNQPLFRRRRERRNMFCGECAMISLGFIVPRSQEDE